MQPSFDPEAPARATAPRRAEPPTYGSTMLPKNLALIEDNAAFAGFLTAYFQSNDVAVTVFSDSDDFLQSSQAYDFEFYVVDLQLPGVSGLDVVRLLRRRVRSGIVVVTGENDPEVVDQVLDAGADMYVVKPAPAEQISIAVKAVHRRLQRVATESTTWKLDTRARTLTTPVGACLPMSDTDLVVMGCFLRAEGKAVSHAEICRQLGREPTDEAANWLHATIYRLRRRVEAATTETLPLHSQSRVGYVFRMPLRTD